MNDRHMPRIEILTKREDPDQIIAGHHQAILVDGERWPTYRYEIVGDVNDAQRVRLEFLANVTMTDVEELP